jgi:LacI family transcriptional regulator
MADVARQAGVAPSTVSHALSSKRPVAAATRECVITAARELGYELNTTLMA